MELVCVCVFEIYPCLLPLLAVCVFVFVLHEVQRAAGGLSEWHKAHGQVIEVIKVGQEWRRRRRRGRGGGEEGAQTHR